MKAIYLALAFICLPVFAGYTTMTIEGVQQANGVWTAAGVMDTQGFVRTTGAVTIAGSTASTAVSLPVHVGEASKILRIAGKLAGPASVALAGYDLYQAFESARFVNINGQWKLVSGGKPSDIGTSSVCNGTTYINCYTPLPDANATCSPRGAQYGAQGRIYALITGSSPWYYCHEIFPAPYNATPTDQDFNSVVFGLPALSQGFNNLPSLIGQPIPISGINFKPYSEWYGDPYFKDGNWWRDRMDVSPAPTTSQPTRVRVDIGPIKIEGATNPDSVPDTGPAGGGSAQPKEEPSFCEANPGSIACQEMGEVEQEPLENDEVQFNLDTNQSWGSSNASCPANPSITIHSGQTITFNYQPACDFFALLRPIIIAFSLLTAVFIAIGRTE